MQLKNALTYGVLTDSVIINDVDMTTLGGNAFHSLIQYYCTVLINASKGMQSVYKSDTN